MGNQMKKDFIDLRKAAQKVISEKMEISSNSSDNLNHDLMLNELKIYQIELEVQNQELFLSKEKLEESETRYKNMFQFAPIAYVTLNKSAIIIEKNKKALDILGIQIIEKKPFVIYIHQEDHHIFFSHCRKVFEDISMQDCEVRLKVSTGEFIYVKLYSIVHQGEFDKCLTAIVDVDEVRKKEALISKLAFYDSLTGVSNRAGFLQKLMDSLNVSKENNIKFALLFIDIDNFKKINDTMGHKIGDIVLKNISQLMIDIIPKKCFLSRLGGDEFTIIVPFFENNTELEVLSRKIIQSIKIESFLPDKSHNLGASIGISIYPIDGESSEDILKNADTAMYKAKSIGKNIFYFYNNSLKDEIQRRAELELNLSKAINDNTLSIHFQPQIKVSTGKIRGMEALLRWNNKELGNIPPSIFISIAEETGLIIPIGDWVLYQSCLKNKEWQDMGLDPIIISVNISYVQLKEKNFVKNVMNILESTGLDSKYLELEITESVLITDYEYTISELKKLKNIGVKICLDDFGTGYSSLNYINILPLETIKIDKSFISNIEEDKSKKLVEAIITIAHKLDLEIVAEGIETEKQKDFLMKCNCDVLQGYYHYKPLIESEARKVLKQN